MDSILLIFQFALVVLICVFVMMQKSSSIGLGAYSGSNESLFGAKGPAGFLAKATFVLGFLLVVNTIALGYSYNKTHDASVLDRVQDTSLLPNAAQATSEEVKTEAPVAAQEVKTEAPVATQEVKTEATGEAVKTEAPVAASEAETAPVSQPEKKD